MNFLNLTMINGESIATSATMLMGQSIGKKRPDMAQAYTSRCRRTGLAFALILSVLFVFLRHPLTKLYTDDTSVVQTSALLILILALYQPFQASQFVVSGALRGAGDTFAIAVVNFLCALLLRPILAALAVFALNLGAAGAWYAFLLDQIVRSILIGRRFSSGKWKTVFFSKREADIAAELC
jgi:Na+-driven multidrug efflux pump